jgi:hypothetical protein
MGLGVHLRLEMGLPACGSKDYRAGAGMAESVRRSCKRDS